MKRLASVLALVAVFASADAVAQAVVNIGGGPGTPSRTNFLSSQTRGTTDNWVNDSIYVIYGTYFVDSISTLSIEPGTIILGDSAAGGTLVVGVGGSISAPGTSTSPIVIMPSDLPGARQPGDWGGFVVLGDAPENQSPQGGSPQIEGGIIPGVYGGSNPAHNGGTYQHMRLEYPGFRFQVNNEINGMTFGAVGSGTTVNHIQVSYANDDAFEFFGGRVNAKNLIAFGTVDDKFDTDFGYQGKIQFGFGLDDPTLWDPTGETQGFESDNQEPASTDEPRTRPVFSNVTLVGPQRTDATIPVAANRYRWAQHTRRGSHQQTFNSALTGWNSGLRFQDNQTVLVDADGQKPTIKNTSLAIDISWASSVITGTLVNSGPSPDSSLGTSTAAWVTHPSLSNNGYAATRLPSALGLTDMSDLNNPNPVPTGSSELATAGTDFTGFDPFFTSTSYRGAFDPALSRDAQWGGNFDTWTNFNPQFTQVMATSWNMVTVPLDLADKSVASVFPNAVAGQVFEYDAATESYNPVTGNIVPGKGYWVLYAQPTLVKYPSSPELSGGAAVSVPKAGFVLVGTVTRNAQVSSISDPSGIIVPGQVFRFDIKAGNYVPANTEGNRLFAGQAYWVLCNGAGTITLP